ncbi:PRC-barrel domain-containing protein [uncultured Amnibacterium sp.]|uniref:PRC-barrel domain-containing protein n=1 Tax=uncultured Amnibacterium sp. TaxID=1631851 RepID=UPI0035CA2F32
MGEEIDRLIGADAIDVDDARIGEISQVYLDAESERPTWIGVRLSLLSGTEVMVPLDGAEWNERALRTAVSRDVAKDAPRLEHDEPLTVLEQERLYTHYGIPTVRPPREDVDLDVEPGEVCYSVSDDAAVIDITGRDPGQGSLSRAS